MATIQEIGRSLNLSHTTVSRVLNGRNDQFISEATRQRVRTAAAEMGYRPNRAARTLVTGQTKQVALWARRLTTAYDAQVITWLVQTIEDSDYQVVVRSAAHLGIGKQNEAEGSSESALLDALASVDGCLIFEAMRRQFQPLFQHDVRRPLPVVGMGGASFHSPSMPDMDFVGVDLGIGFEEALRHLMEIGCRRIAFVGPYDRSWAEPRAAVYEAIMTEAGRPIEAITGIGVRRAQVRQGVSEYIERNGCPDGLLCFNDDVAIGAYRAARDKGLRIPDDVAIIGHDGIDDTDYLDSPLTTLAQPVEEMCRLAWQYLLRRIENPSLPPQQTHLRATLLRRASTRR